MLKRLMLGAALLAGLGLSLTSLQAGSIIGYGTPPPSGAAWNPADKDSSITLSTTTTTNDTATQNGAAAAYRAVRATAPHYVIGTNHKVVFTILIVAASNGGGSVVGQSQVYGVSDGSRALNTYIGATAHSYGINAGGGGDYLDGVHNGSVNACSDSGGFPDQTVGVGDTQWIAIDFNTGFTWCAKNGCTSWLGNGTTASPDAGTNSNATISAGDYYIGWSGNFAASTADVAKLNAAPSLGGCTGVTTFHNWNTG